jgi:tRNA (guanine37-N1)-methyltransferase
MLTISIITLFPEMFSGPFAHSIIKRAQEKNLVKINLVNLRQFGIGRHKIVDDKPYGGGRGMILRVDVIDRAINSTKLNIEREQVVLLDPKGKKYTQEITKELSSLSHLILICGHYEGIDERVRKLVDMEISIGDYILSGGEIAAMVVSDSVIRLVPGVLSSKEAVQIESFSKLDNKKILEFPQYTRPAVYKKMQVPKVLLSGDPKKIDKYRLEEAAKLTKKRRPDLLAEN